MKANTTKLSYHVLIGFIAYKILSLASNIVLSYKYGASQYSDAYVTAQAVPVFYRIFSYGLNCGMFYNQAKKDKKINIALVLTVMIIIASAVSAAGYLYPDLSVKIFAYGFDDNATAAAKAF
jgi:putative peptidoglycan lipid II flippase